MSKTWLCTPHQWFFAVGNPELRTTTTTPIHLPPSRSFRHHQAQR